MDSPVSKTTVLAGLFFNVKTCKYVFIFVVSAFSYLTTCSSSKYLSFPSIYFGIFQREHYCLSIHKPRNRMTSGIHLVNESDTSLSMGILGIVMLVIHSFIKQSTELTY